MDSKINSLKNQITARDWILQGTLLKQYNNAVKSTVDAIKIKNTGMGHIGYGREKKKAKRSQRR